MNGGWQADLAASTRVAEAGRVLDMLADIDSQGLLFNDLRPVAARAMAALKAGELALALTLALKTSAASLGGKTHWGP